MHEKHTITPMPASHPSWAMAHAKASTPAPTTTVTMCMLAVNTFPAYIIPYIHQHLTYLGVKKVHI